MDEFEIIYSKYSPRVFRYLISIGADVISAEEITAETFYRAYINFDKFRGESKIETWLCAIAKNEYFKDCKRKAKTTKMEKLDCLPDISNLFDQLLDKEQATAIYRIVREMANPYKEVFLLRILDELSFKEISSLFGKSESWAKVTFFRAKIKILEKLEEST